MIDIFELLPKEIWIIIYEYIAYYKGYKKRNMINFLHISPKLTYYILNNNKTVKHQFHFTYDTSSKLELFKQFDCDMTQNFNEYFEREVLVNITDYTLTLSYNTNNLFFYSNKFDKTILNDNITYIRVDRNKSYVRIVKNNMLCPWCNIRPILYQDYLSSPKLLLTKYSSKNGPNIYYICRCECGARPIEYIHHKFTKYPKKTHRFIIFSTTSSMDELKMVSRIFLKKKFKPYQYNINTIITKISYGLLSAILRIGKNRELKFI
jgi:hypothetical protein